MTKPLISVHKHYQTKSGIPIQILCTDRPLTPKVPVLGISDTGVLYSFDAHGQYLAKKESDFDLVEVDQVGPYDHLKIDDLVLVQERPGKSHSPLYHFAGVTPQGKPKYFPYGRNSVVAEYHGNAPLIAHSVQRYIQP